MSFNFATTRISTNPFVDTISCFSIHKPLCGLQNIHKLFCGSYFSFQYPQNPFSYLSRLKIFSVSSVFIIVVSSIAIKEDVYKSLQITDDHFRELYENVSFDYFVYDSSKLSDVRNFATSPSIQVMVINIDAFRKSFSDPEKGKFAVDKKKNTSGEARLKDASGNTAADESAYNLIMKEKLLSFDSKLKFIFSHSALKEGIKFGKVLLNKAVFLSEEFKQLWDRIKYRTTFRVNFDVDALTTKCAEEIKANLQVGKARFIYRKAKAEIDRGGVHAQQVVEFAVTNAFKEFSGRYV